MSFCTNFSCNFHSLLFSICTWIKIKTSLISGYQKRSVAWYGLLVTLSLWTSGRTRHAKVTEFGKNWKTKCNMFGCCVITEGILRWCHYLFCLYLRWIPGDFKKVSDICNTSKWVFSFFWLSMRIVEQEPSKNFLKF